MAQLQSRYDHVIVGGGVSADKAARSIHEAEPEASIAIISADADGPVYRPALTKDLWNGDNPDPVSQDLATAADTGAELVTSTKIFSISPAEHTVTTADGTNVEYGKLLLATGSTPRKFGTLDDDRVVYFRTVADYRKLRELVREGSRVAIIGGGYIGSEIAAGLTHTGAKITNYFLGEHLLEHMFPTSIVSHLEQVYHDHDIELVPGFNLESIDAGEELTLTAANGDTVTADVAVLGLGAILNTDLAEAAGLTMEKGAVLVDKQLRTSAEDVWAAGDIAHFDDPLFGARHIEHVDNAWASGTTAGKNMAGAGENYDYTPLFYSDLFSDGYEAIGLLSTRFEVKEVWNDDQTAAVVWYLDGDKVQGVLLWNTWDSVPAAREAVRKNHSGELSVEDLAEQIKPGG
ncbi:NAD(P)/FAD-dependent oxidoreductase [Corynebacterium lubricantis]|uniref:NAD(P)/FAD-dependent oxidoreductase n=1 Tax=Corynebacterium lubricantis TaxID=541095 RepID=UPI000373884C|nr:FAD-dependent oxidoreductase [Corynebacterium lubricantis]